jgi:hypothetical protein
MDSALMPTNTQHGIFDFEHAIIRKWKLDNGLCKAITTIVPSRSSVWDLVCGAGSYVIALQSLGYDVAGVDGFASLDEGWTWFRQADLTDRLYEESWFTPRDWVLSIEVGEHIPSEYADNYILNVLYGARSGILLSWAIPGQRGRNHINCQSPEWVIETVHRLSDNWIVDYDQIMTSRSIAGVGWNQKLLVFRRKGVSTTG